MIAAQYIGSTLKANISTYKIQEFIGQGTGGGVYKALDQNKQQLVAIKFQENPLKQNEKECLKKLTQNEFKHVINLLDFGEEKDFSFMVQELAENPYKLKIEEMKRNDQFSLQEKLNHLGQIAYGIYELHKIGLIHRDIKPDNILYNERKDHFEIKLCDLGLAREQNRLLSEKTQGHGTLRYMPPEQRTSKEISEKVDIWAFGILFLEMWPGNEKLIKQIQEQKFNQNQIYQKIDEQIQFTNEIKVLLKDILRINSQERISAKDLYQQLQLNELQNKKNQKQQQSEYVTNTIYNQILLWEKKVKESTYAPQELLQQFEQIKETHEMTKAQIYQASQFQQLRSNDLNDQIQQIQTQIKQLENVIVTQNQIQQKFTYLQDFYSQQKIKYINSLEEQKINLLNQCSAYLEQAKLISQFKSQIVFDQVKQLYNQTIQEIQQLNQLQQQVEQLNISVDLDDPKLQFNEKLLRQLQMDVEKKNTLILDYKNKFLTALQQQKEAQNVLQKCKNAYNQLLNQTNFQEQIQRQINQLNQIQAQVQSIVNPELTQLINQKHLNIKQKEQEIQALQIQLKSTFTSDMIKTEDQFQIVVKDFNLKTNNLKTGIDSEIASISDLEYRVQQTLKQCKTKMDQEVSEVSYFIDQELKKKLANHEQNILQLTCLNQLQQFEILKDNGLTKQIEKLKEKVNKYEKQYQELREDLKLFQEEQNQYKQSSFPDQQKNKMQQLQKISQQIYECQDKLKKQVEWCEKQQKDIKYYNDQDVEKLQQKLIKQIEQEEAQMQNYKIKLDELNNLQIEYQKGFNTNEILSKLKNQEQLYKSSIIAIQQINYEEEWQFQIQRLIPIKQQYQLCRCYILLSNIFDLERLCKRRFDKLTEKQYGDNSKVNLSDKRNKDLQEIQQIFKVIDENKSFLNQQADRLKINENDIDLTLEFQNIEQQVNQYQINLENAIKSNNLVKLRGSIKNQDLIKSIQQQFIPHLEGNRMKLIEFLTQSLYRQQ